MKYRGHFFKSMNPLNKIREDIKGMKAAISELTRITTSLLTDEMKTTSAVADTTEDVMSLSEAIKQQAGLIASQQQLIMELGVKVAMLERKAEEDEEYRREQAL